MTQHFPNLPDSTTLGARDELCSGKWQGRNRSDLDRVFHESGPVAFYESEGRRTAPLCCIHCGRTFEGDFSGQVTDKTLTGAA